MNIEFPPAGGSGIANFVYWLVSSIMSWGWLSYGFAIVFFTLFIKLMLCPLDFLNRYFTRKTQVQTQALSAEIQDLERTYGNDPLAFARARQALLRKNGVGGGAGALFTIISLIVTLTVFINVMNALNEISHYNIYMQYQKLDAVYQEYKDGDATVLHDKLNETYNQNTTSFFWIKNIWQPDNFWSNSVFSFDQYNGTQPEDRKLSEEQKGTYEAIYTQIDVKDQGNGWLVLVILAGAASFLSARLSARMTARQAPKKAPTKQPEEVITYSMRDAKLQSAAKQPQVDPAQVGKIMQFIMPIILMIFAMTQTSAFAIYMIASSLISTAITIGFGYLVDLIIKKQKPKKIVGQDFDASIINPHAKYFKGGKK